MAARARNLKASRFLYKADVMARVESEDDIAFWQKAIHTVRPNVKVKFIPAEISESNERQRGKTLLYMQGHCVFDLVLRIGNFLCNGKSDFLYEVLIPSYTCNGYHEIDMVKSDIAQNL